MVLRQQPLGGDAIWIVAHEHVGEVGTVMDALLGLLRGGPHATATLVDRLDDSLERRLMEVSHNETLASVESHLVRRRGQVVVRQVLHHIAKDNCVHPFNGRDVEPPVCVLLMAGGRFLPVCKLLVVPRATDEETTNVILSGDDEKAVIRVRADASAFLTLSIGSVAGWETDVKTKR